MIVPSALDRTRPNGRCFISYRRTRLGEIQLLVALLHEHGIPTWQDLQNLDEEPLEPALRSALSDRDIASGVAWITPEVADSPVITGVEIPGLITRAERGDGFYLVPVAAGGLNYDGAASAAKAATTLNDFATWNLVRLARDPILAEDAATVARRVLARRVDCIQLALPDEAPFVVDLYSRTPAVTRPDAALTVDLTHLFDGRHAESDDWQNRILPAFDHIAQCVAKRAPDRPLHLRGLLGLPAALALGTSLLAPRSGNAAWIQQTPGKAPVPYSLAVDRKASGFRLTSRDGNTSAADLAVLVSASENIIPAIQATLNLPNFRGWIQADPPATHPHFFATAGEAVDLAKQLVEAIRGARARYGQSGSIHLFIAGPVGLAFLIGQQLNTLGDVHTYEHVSDSATGHYVPAVILRPSR